MRGHEDPERRTLTFDEFRESVRELAQQGLWTIGAHVPGRVTVAIYRRKDAYYLIHDGGRDRFGFGIVRRDLPATVVPRPSNGAVLGETVMTVLQSLDLRPEQPVARSRFPVLRQAGVGSWLQFVKTSAQADATRLGSIVMVGTWVRDLSRLDDASVPGPAGYAVLHDPTPQILGLAVETACDAVQP